MTSLSLLARTLLQYEPKQLASYVLRRFNKPVADLRSPAPIRARVGTFVAPIARPFPEVAPSRIKLLNIERRVAEAADWNADDAEMLWLYTLHYQEGLSNFDAGADRQRMSIQNWIAANPPVIGAGWDAYPISLRAVQWIKWFTRVEPPNETMRANLTAQVRYLRKRLETHLGANHLFANAVALVAAGYYFAGEEGARWQHDGLALLGREIASQYLADGAHFELSPSYHALLLENLLDLENLAQAYGFVPPRPQRTIVPRALRWLDAMTRPDGTFAQFNDCAEGVAPSFAELKAYADRLGISFEAVNSVPLLDFPDSGYTRAEGKAYVMHIDAGSFAPSNQPGHGHCDMLSFELSVAGLPIIINSGTSTYERSARRHWERGTRAHNTVQVADAEQTEIWSAFRAGRRARIIEREVLADGLIAAHDGFRPLEVIHRRSFRFASQEMTITDTLEGSGAGLPSVARLHFAPGLEPVLRGQTLQVGDSQITFSGQASCILSDYEQANAFNNRRHAKVAEISFTGRLDTRIQIG